MCATQRSWLRHSSLVAILSLTAACGGGGSGGASDQTRNESTDLNPPANAAPVIAGTPATEVRAGDSYAFAPAATDPDSDPLTFSIANKPDWASFDSASGALTGRPDIDVIGTTLGIVISVSDGRQSASLPSFDLVVSPPDNPDSGNIAISNTQPARYEWTVLEDGQKAYIDRDFRFGDIPNQYEGLDFLQAANDDMFVSAQAAISFEVATPVTVFVGYDSRATVLPDWLDGWTKTRDHWDGPEIQTDVYARDYPAGTIVLGGNEMGYNMYVVALAVPGAVDFRPATPLPPDVANSAPTISGSPARSATTGSMYDFLPSAADADGDALTFSITNMPPWATFSTSTGRLSGTPKTADIGAYADIVISVSDDRETDSLTFSIDVDGETSGSATLAWMPPLENADGTPLNDLAGYRIYYSQTLGTYWLHGQIDNPGVTTYVLEDLSEGTWYFVATAIDLVGNESVYSNVASKTILLP